MSSIQVPYMEHVKNAMKERDRERLREVINEINNEYLRRVPFRPMYYNGRNNRNYRPDVYDIKDPIRDKNAMKGRDRVPTSRERLREVINIEYLRRVPFRPMYYNGRNNLYYRLHDYDIKDTIRVVIKKKTEVQVSTHSKLEDVKGSHIIRETESVQATEDNEYNGNGAHIIRETEAVQESVVPGVSQFECNQNQELSLDMLKHEDLPCYKMDAPIKGLCIIIKNETFYQEDKTRHKLDDRNGTDKDAENLSRIFEQRHFSVQQYDDLTDEDMKRLLLDISRIDHSKYDCFICCILTHGSPNLVYGTNGKPVSIVNLTSCFTARCCPSLTSKPKIFFIQACQGNNTQHVIGLATGIDMDTKADASKDEDQGDMLVHEQDFFIGYSSAPGYLSFLNKTNGSFYIKNLTEVFTKYCRYDLISMMLKVKEEVCKENIPYQGKVYMQTPVFSDFLTKLFYFR